MQFSDLASLRRMGNTMWARLRHVLFAFKLLGLVLLVVALAALVVLADEQLKGQIFVYE